MQDMVNFSFKMFKMRSLRSSDVKKKRWSSPKQPVELTQKLATGTSVPHSLHCFVVSINGQHCFVVTT